MSPVSPAVNIDAAAREHADMPPWMSAAQRRRATTFDDELAVPSALPDSEPRILLETRCKSVREEVRLPSIRHTVNSNNSNQQETGSDEDGNPPCQVGQVSSLVPRPARPGRIGPVAQTRPASAPMTTLHRCAFPPTAAHVATSALALRRTEPAYPWGIETLNKGLLFTRRRAYRRRASHDDAPQQHHSSKAQEGWQLRHPQILASCFCRRRMHQALKRLRCQDLQKNSQHNRNFLSCRRWPRRATRPCPQSPSLPAPQSRTRSHQLKTWSSSPWRW